VGTITEIYDYLRLLVWPRVGRAALPGPWTCRWQRKTVSQIGRPGWLAMPEGPTLMLLARFFMRENAKANNPGACFVMNWRAQGFVRARIRMALRIFIDLG